MPSTVTEALIEAAYKALGLNRKEEHAARKNDPEACAKLDRDTVDYYWRWQ